MNIPFPIYKSAHTILSKAMKFVGDNIAPISAAGIAICVQAVQDRKEKNDTKYEYNGWLLYKQRDFLYAKNGKQKIKVEAETNNFCKLENMIKNITEYSSCLDNQQTMETEL